MENVSALKFEGQKEGEEVILFIEKHWIKDLRIFALLLIIGVMPGAIAYVLSAWIFTSQLTIYYILSFLFLYELFVILYLFIVQMNEELDIFIVTNQRVVDITQVGLLERKISDTPLSNIQDVSATCKGLLETLFNFGTITVQTAGHTTEFSMHLVPKPFAKGNKIMELIKDPNKETKPTP